MVIGGRDDVVRGLKHRYKENQVEEKKQPVHVSRGRGKI
jgi:hypothetical protein